MGTGVLQSLSVIDKMCLPLRSEKHITVTEYICAGGGADGGNAGGDPRDQLHRLLHRAQSGAAGAQPFVFSLLVPSV